MDSSIVALYGKRVRVRACGVCLKNNSLLLVNHAGLRDGSFWAPPGGGIEFGQTAEETVMREFEEETGIRVSMGKFLFACEFIKEPLHAIELFFEVLYQSGEVVTGSDPEMKTSQQIIRNAQWLPWTTIKAMPAEQVHGRFARCHEPNDLMHLNAYYRI